MKEIFTWGFEHPNKNDYTKNKAAISNKIRKMQTAFISEAHDNFRGPQKLALGWDSKGHPKGPQKESHGLRTMAHATGKGCRGALLGSLASKAA